jgi:hypothetical protein
VFMKKLRQDSQPIPPSGTVGGNAYDIKFFPDSQNGKGGPFPDPTATRPTNGDFPRWVDYYVNLVGGKLEILNGLQFNLDAAPGINLAAMSTELGILANELKVGSGNSPKELRWPLAGSYKFAWSPQDAKTIGFQTFIIDLYFEDERDYRMVVNCSIEISAKIGTVSPDSSSSSYIATSSSK